MKLTLVAVVFLVGYLTKELCSVTAMADSNSGKLNSPTLNQGRINSFKSDSTEQLSDDGREEIRRIENPEDWKSWEGQQSMDLGAKSEGVRVTRAEKMEALQAFAIATITAIVCNILTKAAIQNLS